MGKVTFQKAEILESHIHNADRSDADMVAGAKVTPEMLEEIDRVCIKDRMRNRSDFVREGIALRLTYTGARYFKLIGHAEAVCKFIDSLDDPVVAYRL